MAHYQRGGGGRFESPAPKPYDMVPLPNQVARQRPTGHEQYHTGRVTGQIHGTITALSPIHISSGVVELGQDVPLIKTAVRTGGRIVIPGSSLKGAIRSLVEAISESCICKSSVRSHEMPRGFSECRDKNRLCVACRMFGAMGFQGNVSIHDAPHIQGQVVTLRVPEFYAPSKRRRAYFNESREVAGRKFYMHGRVASGNTPVEACAVGSTFRFSVQGDNLTEAEWGLLLIAWGLHPDYAFKLKIGGAKPACFGSIDIQIERIQTVATPEQRYLNWEDTIGTVLTEGALHQWSQTSIRWMGAAMNSLVKRPQLTKLAEILRYPNDRSCPSGLY